jgi:RNA polymerase sigma-70 factor (ECF subfamily)
MKLSELTAQQLLDECLRANTEDAWTEFIRRLHPLVSGVIVKTAQRYLDLPFSTVEDLVQETYLRLCRDNRRPLREFQWKNDSAIFSFVKVVSASVTLDYFKRIGTEKRRAEVSLADDPPEQPVTERGFQTALLMSDVERAFAGIDLDERDRAIFWLYFRHGLSAKEISSIGAFNLSIKGVESCLHRLTSLLREHLAPVRSRTVGQEGNS